MLYGKDLIAERDEKNRLHSSVIKWWNDINYINMVNKQIEAYNTAYLAQTQQQNAKAGQADSDYNAATGSFSGAYGKNEELLNAKEKDQVKSILAEKEDSIAAIVNSNHMGN